MKTLLVLMVGLFAYPACLSAQESATPATSTSATQPAPVPLPGGAPPPSARGEVVPGAPLPATDVSLDELPWSPNVHHADEFPYDHPLKIDSDYFGPPGEFWFHSEGLLWAIKDQHLPPLVTAGPAGSGGVPGAPGVTTLFGASTVDGPTLAGAQLGCGAWFETSYTIGFEISYFFLTERTVRFGAASPGTPGSAELAEPFISVATGKPSALLLAAPGVASGSVFDQVKNELQGGEADWVWNFKRTRKFSVDLLAGFRYLDLGGSVDVTSDTTSLAGATAGTNTITDDHFSVHNHFYGGEVGIRGDYRWHWLVLGATEKLALGGNTSDIAISGYTLQTAPGGAVTSTNTGFYAQSSNIGSHSNDRFAVVNEFDLKAGWQICDYVQAYVGYSLLTSSAVVRPGDIVDTGMGPGRPMFIARDTDFWAQGLTAGVEIRY